MPSHKNTPPAIKRIRMIAAGPPVGGLLNHFHSLATKFCRWGATAAGAGGGCHDTVVYESSFRVMPPNRGAGYGAHDKKHSGRRDMDAVSPLAEQPVAIDAPQFVGVGADQLLRLTVSKPKRLLSRR